MVNRKNDYAFKRIFGHEDTKDILARFLTVVLDVQIEPGELTLVHTEFSPEYVADKASVLDIQVRRSANHEKMNIEMQIADDGDLARRVLFYWSKGYIEDLKEGGDYGTLPRMVSIIVVDFDVHEWKNKTKFHGAFRVMEPEEGKVFSDALEIHVLELPKLRRQPVKKEWGALECWCLYLDNAGGEIMENIAGKEPLIRRARTVEEVFAKDEEERRLYELREKGRRSFESALNASERKVRREVARSMLADGIPLERVLKITSLTAKDLN